MPAFQFFDHTGADEVFAVTADHHLWQHSLNGWALESAESFQTLSGNAGVADVGEVFAGLSDGSLAEYKLPFVGVDDAVRRGAYRRSFGVCASAQVSNARGRKIVDKPER